MITIIPYSSYYWVGGPPKLWHLQLDPCRVDERCSRVRQEWDYNRMHRVVFTG